MSVSRAQNKFQTLLWYHPSDVNKIEKPTYKYVTSCRLHLHTFGLLFCLVIVLLLMKQSSHRKPLKKMQLRWYWAICTGDPSQWEPATPVYATTVNRCYARTKSCHSPFTENIYLQITHQRLPNMWAVSAYILIVKSTQHFHQNVCAKTFQI